ncbi:MAG: O-antigen ligase family protein [Acidobacteria bacterium]|nr:O-antigen ligase family protein [Acidobacteriota bacterium]
MSEARGLFFSRLAFFSLLLALFALCRRVPLERILAPISGGIALILFTYGIIQKFLIFPMILEQLAAGPSFYAHALRVRVASGRIFSIFPLPTLYAMVCGLLLIFIIHFLYLSRGVARLFWGGLFILGAFNLVLTQSFGGILFFTVGVLFYLFTLRKFSARLLAPLLMLLALVLFLVTALRFSDARELTPARLRFANWAQAGRLIAQSPLLGVGLGNYETSITPLVRPDEPPSIYAHNFFLQMAAETGVPMFLLLAGLCLPWLKANLPRFVKPENALFAAACVLLLFFNLFDVGNYFFAAGISFAVVFSQVARSEARIRPFHVVAVSLLAVVLLLQATAAGRQRAGDVALHRNEAQRAENLYRASLKLDPFSYRPWLGLAQIAWEKNDIAAVEAHLAHVLRIHPGQAFANYRVSQIAQRRGAYLTALAHARRAALANKRNSEYQRWHDHIQGNLAQQPALSGN